MLSGRAYSFRQRSRLAISLSWIAGYTNVIAFIMLGSIVVSHVTGNVTQIGLAAANVISGKQEAYVQLLFFGLLVGGFFCGAVASALMTELARQRGVVSKYVLPMAVEALLLLALAIGVWLHFGGWIDAGYWVNHYWMTIVAASAMGLQNATITKISGAVIRTTHLTGVTTDLGLESVQYVLWLRERGRRRGGHAGASHPPRFGRAWKLSRRQPSFQRLLLLSSIFGSFLFGTVGGTLAFYLVPRLALAAPAMFLVWIIAFDWRKPIADVTELDLTADPDFSGSADIREMLPEHVGLYRLSHFRRDKAHHAPDFQAWAERLPKTWRIVILAVSPMTHFEPDSALNLAVTVRALRDERRDLILLGLKPSQFRVLQRGGLIEILGRDNVAADIEFAIARAINLLETTTAPPP